MGAELRRQDFIEATVKVIAEHGVANATTRRIAAAANSPLASLHYVFHTKDELFYAVYESMFSVPQQALELEPSGATAAENAADMLRQMVKWFTAHPELATAQSELFFWTLRNKPEMASKIYSMAGEVTERAIERVTDSQLDRATLIRVSRLILNLVDGLLLGWSGHGDLKRLETETETACQAVKLLVASN
ncbi:TetR family transcriptional regulator [Pseudomonas alcaligenes]|uniref:TetR family transcriptional regulator n=2 Tax=Aquipseudomonas alcaligenes TaxID=43263 RepID=A0ABR7S219_AQUAC|nr:TetR family transcriptional regulator [Pseudomonas alcaligenes]